VPPEACAPLGAETAGCWSDLFDLLLAAGGVFGPATRKVIVIRLVRLGRTVTFRTAEAWPPYSALTE
jgi:hypothetical protein